MLELFMEWLTEHTSSAQEYTKDSGYGVQRGAELGMYWLILNHDKKMIRIVDTDKMLETMDAYL